MIGLADTRREEWQSCDVAIAYLISDSLPRVPLEATGAPDIYWVRDDRLAFTSKKGSATLVAENVDDALCFVVHAYVQAY